MTSELEPPVPVTLPLSPAQRRVWFVDRLGSAGSAYNVPHSMRLTGFVDIEALSAAFRDVVARHEPLRTVFPLVDDEPCQRVLDIDAVPPVLHHSDTADPAAIRAAAAHRFDLAAEPPIRAELFEVDSDEWLLVITVHHIATDGLSQRPLLADLSHAYTARRFGAEPGWPPLPVQYTDYTVWHQDLLGDPADQDSIAAADLAYWWGTLASLPDELPLPTDRPRPAVLGHVGDAVPVRVGAGLFRRLSALARAEGCSPFMVVQAALAATLTRLGAGHDIPIGSPVSGRSEDALDDLVGFFVNTLVLRADTSGNPTFRELLTHVRDSDLAAYEHQELPFDRILEAVNPARSLAMNPMFQVCLAIAGPPARLTLPGAEAGPAELMHIGTAKFDLEFLLDQRDGGIGGDLVYNAEIIDRATAQRVVDSLLRLLETVVAEPDRPIDDVDVLSATDKRELALWHENPGNVTDATLPGLFAWAAAEHPDVIALRSGNRTLTYRELDEHAAGLAGALVSAGVRRGDIVGVLVGRGIEFAVAVLAVVRAGAAYTLLDPDFPDRRLHTTIEDIGPRLVVTTPALAQRISCTTVDVESRVDNVPAVTVGPDDLACVMFTSGSTGRPKGVMSPHRALVGSLLDQSYADFGPGEVFLQCSPVSWDAFALEFWGALGFGGTCVLHPGQRPEPAIVRRLAAEHGVTMLQLSASLFNYLVDEAPDTFGGLRLAFTGGETASATHVARILARYPELRVVNGYGPAESMGFTTTFAVPADITGTVSIGGPVLNKRAYVLDGHLRYSPIGVLGEVYLGGVGLADGYAAHPDITAHRFVADPFVPGERMYRTGDLARWTNAGTLEFAGRVDDQVKIRGFRVEPGEVEAMLCRHDAVRQAAAVAWRPAGQPTRLVAYVVTHQPVAPLELRAWLAERLPEHMVPSAVTILDALPITANGKLDRRALPDPSFIGVHGRAARDEREEILCRLFADILGAGDVSIDDAFFDLGGHSLLAAKLISRVRTVLGVELTIRDIFQAPTVAELALRIPHAAKTSARRPALRRRTGAGAIG